MIIFVPPWQIPRLGLTGTGRKHSSLVGGSAEEDKDVDELGEEEDEEAPVKELRRCVERGQNDEGGANHKGRVLAVTPSRAY